MRNPKLIEDYSPPKIIVETRQGGSVAYNTSPFILEFEGGVRLSVFSWHNLLSIGFDMSHSGSTPITTPIDQDAHSVVKSLMHDIPLPMSEEELLGHVEHLQSLVEDHRLKGRIFSALETPYISKPQYTFKFSMGHSHGEVLLPDDDNHDRLEYVFKNVTHNIDIKGATQDSLRAQIRAINPDMSEGFLREFCFHIARNIATYSRGLSMPSDYSPLLFSKNHDED